MISTNYIFHKLLYSSAIVFLLKIILIINYKSIDDLSIENLTLSIRIILLSDVDRLPARQMSRSVFSSENRSLSHSRHHIINRFKDPRHRSLVLLSPDDRLRYEKRNNHLLVADRECHDILSLRNLTGRLRIYRDFKLKHLFSEGPSRLLINEFEENVFPWMRKSDSLFNEYKKGTKGILICLNNKYFQIGISSIMALQVLGNKLPIEIIFNGNDELSIENRNILKTLPFVRNVIDINIIFNNSRKYFPIGERISGTYIKPFGILASSFQHVLLMDADVYFFQKPSNLFDSNGYLNRNFLLFSDRTIWSDKQRGAYIQSIMPQPWSEKFKQSRLVNSISGHEIESGVVLINKGIQKSYLTLLTICLLNTRCYRREMLRNKQYNGEKETYWLGLEMIEAPYYKIDQVGVLGDVNEDGNIVCGQLFHGDESQNPLWWNGGFRRSKREKNSPWIKFTSYMWEVEYNSSLWTPYCLTRSSQKIQKLSDQQLQLIQIYKKYNCSTFHW